MLEILQTFMDFIKISKKLKIYYQIQLNPLIISKQNPYDFEYHEILMDFLKTKLNT